jgi:hypothetical protein
VTIEEATQKGIDKITCTLWKQWAPYRYLRLHFMKDQEGKLLKEETGNYRRWPWVNLHDIYGERPFALSQAELEATDWEAWAAPQ